MTNPKGGTPDPQTNPTAESQAGSSPSAGDFGTLVEDYKGISKGVSTVHLVISVAVTGISPVILQLLEPYRTIGEMILLTAPLTCSAAILTLMVMRGSFEEMTGMGRIFSVGLAIISPYLIAEYFGLVKSVGPSYSPSVGWLHPARLAQISWAILTHYFSVYGLARVFSSLVCGCYLAWVVERKILSRVRQV